MVESADRSKQFQDVSAKYIAPLENEGELEFEGHKAAEAADKVLSGDPDYVGVIPVGSMVRAYRTAKSDVDLVILHKTKFDSRTKVEFEDSVEEKIRGILETNHHLHCMLIHIDRDVVQGTIFSTLRGNLPIYASWINIFSPAAIGPKIEEYRNIARDEMIGLDSKTQDLLINEFAEAKVISEKLSKEKIYERFQDIEPEQLNNLFSKREELWKEQIKQALGFYKSS